MRGWRRTGGGAGEVVQEAAGLVRIRRGDAGLSFAEPPLVRDGPVDEALVERIAALLGLERGGSSPRTASSSRTRSPGA